MVSAVDHRTRLPAFLFTFAALVSAVIACGGDDDPPPGNASSGGPGGDGGPAPACGAVPPPETPAGACTIRISTPPIAADNAQHVAVGTPVVYCTNPPTTGPHYNEWADFKEYDHPIDARNLVHSMEHGAVILFYKCDGGAAGCPDVVAGLRAAKDEADVDPKCAQLGAVRSRIILAPSPDIPTQVAAAAWGATYEADCVDRPSLDAFIRNKYAKAPEDFCFPGRGDL